MKKYILARATINPIMVKFAKMLRSKGARVESISIYEPIDTNKDAFDKCHYLLPLSDKKKQKTKVGMAKTYLSLAMKVRKVMKPIKDADMVIGVSEPNAFVYFIFLYAKCKKIFFPYDICQLRYKNYRQNKWYDWLFEKRNFNRADAIIHKAPEDIFKKVSDKKSLQFLPYADYDDMENTNDKLEGTHLVYVGLVYDGKNRKGTYPLHNVFTELVKNNLHVHVYPTNYKDLAESSIYKDLQENEYFHLHKPIRDIDLRKELSKYHWGLYILYFDDIFKREWADSVFGNKVADYVEAGLPTIANKGLPFVCKIVEDYGLGICVRHYNDIPKVLDDTNYDKIKRNMSINRHQFTMDKHNHKLINFLEEVLNE